MVDMKLLRYLLTIALLAPVLQAAEFFVYFGTYSRPHGGKGIYLTKFDSATGKAGDVTLAAEVANPSFVAIHPNHRFLYAVSEFSGPSEEKGGGVSAFTIDRATGKLKIMNTVSSKGGGPCHLNVDKTGKCVAVANYGTGSVAALPIKEDGSLGEATAFIQHSGTGADPKRQKGPHGHSVNYSFDNRFVIAADLGLDELIVYKFDPSKCSLEANDPPFAKTNPGAGPRHFTFHPKGRFAYSINELQSTVTAFSWDAKKGVLKPIQTITTLPEGYKAESYTAEVVAHPSGKFLYGSNRGHDSIAVFNVDASKGTLTPVEQTSTQGKIPRNFAIDPTGTWLFAANQDTDNVVIFKIDQQTGRLTPSGQSLKVYAPVCVRFLAVE